MKKILTLLVLCLFIFKVNAQDLYDLNTIQTIEIIFAESNWDALLDAEKAGDENYILAQSVTLNGEVFDSVGVKYKGNSTYNPNQTKNPFHIELDTYKDHIYDGYTDIKLSNAAKDPSFIREVLSYKVLRKYMDAPLSNYATVHVNGTLIGLYSNSESISKKFVNKRFYSKSNTFVKCSPPDGAGPGTSDYPNLVYLGEDSSAYYDAYELKSDAGWNELIDLCDTLSNYTDDIEKILDVDRALWMLAFNNMLVNLDSYTGGFSQNYYLYRDDYGRFLPVVWDLNESFGGFTMTGTINLNNNTAKQQMTPLLHENDAQFPLIQKLLAVPMFKRMYLAHCKTMLLENFDNNSYFVDGDSLQNVIDAAVQADQNKFYSYANFIDNLTTDVGGGGGPGGGATIGITNLMDARNTYLLGLTEFTQIAPSISTIEASNTTPDVNETITITAELTDEVDVFIGYRGELGAPFTRLAMFDDGSHGDGDANDGTYGIDVVVEHAFVEYYLYAENANAGIFSPQRAAHEYYTINAKVIVDTMAGDVVINEFMASNDQTVADQDGEFDDWIELYNNTDESISLDGYFMSDDDGDLLQWQFPTGTSIDANGYLIIWADNDGDQDGLHASFKLSAGGETVYLVDADSVIADEITYVDQTTDISYGRYPNGTGSFIEMNPTFNAENDQMSSTYATETIAANLYVAPNPAKQSFYIEMDDVDLKERVVIISRVDGKVMYQNIISTRTSIDVSTWSAGLYFVRVDNTCLKLMVQ